MRAPVLDELSHDHDVAVLDLPGYGASSPPRGITSPTEVADLLAGVLDALEWRDALVAGTSLGGWFALELALSHPRRVRGAVVCAAAGLQSPEDYLFALFVDGRAAAGTERLVEDGLIGRLAPADRAIVGQSPAMANAVVGPYAQTLAAAAACSWHWATANPRLLRRLCGLATPVTVLWGEHDALIPLAHGRLLASTIPAATLEILPSTGHLIPLERPDAFAAAVRRRTGRMLPAMARTTASR